MFGVGVPFFHRWHQAEHTGASDHSFITIIHIIDIIIIVIIVLESSSLLY